MKGLTYTRTNTHVFEHKGFRTVSFPEILTNMQPSNNATEMKPFDLTSYIQ